MSVATEPHDRYVVGVDFGTLSGRALVVRVADGAELGTAVHAYRHGVIETGAARRPARRCRRTGRCRIRTTTARCCATPCRPRSPRAGVDAGDGRRHRHRLHRLHGPADAGRRHAAVRAARAARPAARLREAVEAPRRPAARRPDQRRWRTSAASRGSAGTAARSPPSGSSPRGCSCSRRTRRSTRRAERWIEAADWIVWQLCGAETRNVCTAGYKGIHQDGRYPSPDYLAALNPDFADFVAQARPSAVAARRAGRRADRRGGRAGPACPRASRSRSATSTPT